MWLRTFASCAAVLLTCLGPGGSSAQAEGSGPRVPADWTFTLPAGDAAAGRSVFDRMECVACHTMGKAKPPTRGTSGVGPDLTNYSGLPPEYLAESIISAHTVVAAPGYTVEDGKAGMGNYNHFLTVQELVDLVAFLRGPGAGN